MKKTMLSKYSFSLVLLIILTGLLSIISSCGGGGGGGAILPSSGLTLSGVVSDPTGSVPVPVGGVTVSVRKTNNNAVATTTTTANGSFTLTNVPASTEIYINTSKTNYASTNTEIASLSTSFSGAVLTIIPKTLATDVANALNSGASWSAWSWFAMSVENEQSYTDVPGVVVTVDPNVTILYNDGSDVFSSLTGSTVGSTSMPLLGGFCSYEQVYTFTLTKSSNTHTVKLPMVKGELTYADIHVPW